MIHNRNQHLWILMSLLILLLLAGCTSSQTDPTTVSDPTTEPDSEESPSSNTPESSSESDRRTVVMCDDSAEWPPYIYFQREDGEPTTELVGYSIDVATEILGAQDIDFTVEMLPWQRCLDEVETGENIVMLMNASYNDERAEIYYFSRAYYWTNAHYFYSKEHHPDGLEIETLADLQNYRVCGILGYNYTEYKVEVDTTGVTNIETLVEKIKNDRCDLFIEKLEPIAGFSAVGQDILGEEDLGFAPIPEVESTPFYMMFSKTEEGAELRDIFDAGIEEMEASGRLQELIDQYVP